MKIKIKDKTFEYYPLEKRYYTKIRKWGVRLLIRKVSYFNNEYIKFKIINENGRIFGGNNEFQKVIIVRHPSGEVRPYTEKVFNKYYDIKNYAKN